MRAPMGMTGMVGGGIGGGDLGDYDSGDYEVGCRKSKSWRKTWWPRC